uniref:RNA-binding protein 5 n=1 Tax=Trichuris muris TaxID=70415 RepID=A0A5S6QR96_TRIMR
MGSDYRRKDSSRHNECDSTYYSEDSWHQAYDDDKFGSSYDKRSAERSKYWREYDRSSDSRKHHSPRSRRRSRSRSRDRDDAPFRSKRVRYDDDYSSEGSRHRHRQEVEPCQTIIVKGLGPKYDDAAVWNAITEQGFQPKDVRILKRRDTGVSRGFGFVEFADVDEATRWLKHTQGYLVIDGHRVAEMEYSANRSSYGSAAFSGNMQRGGDWICGKCSTNNFKKRDYCFKCGVRREDSDSICGDGFSEIGVLPSDTLLFRNLPYQIDEAKILNTLTQSCSVDVCQIYIARNPETGLSRGYAYVQLNSVTDAAQLLTNLTAVTKLIIDGREILVSYSKIPLTTVIARAALSQNVDISAKYGDASQNYFAGQPFTSSVNQQADCANAAAAVAQSAIKKAQVMRKVVAEQSETQYPELSAHPVDNNQDVTGAVSTFPASVSEGGPAEQASFISLGTVATPFGELQRYPIPDVSTYRYDQSSGYYYDSMTGFYYDAKTSYYYNPLTQQFVYWEPSYQTYLPAPTQQQQQQNQAQGSAGGREGEPEEKPKKQSKDRHDKVKVAKKIQKDMEKWARQLNQRKEGISSRRTIRQQGSVQEQSPSLSGSADAAFVVLGRSGVDPDIGSSSLAEQHESDEERARTSEGSIGSLEEQLLDWEKLTCLLCRRQFQSKDILMKHQQFSELHKKNLQRKQAETPNSSFSSATAGSSYSGRYRDRAKERREKFGLDDQVEPNALKEKFLVESVSEETVSSPLQMDNKGAKLLRSMGWQEGQGLGRQNQGITDPITVRIFFALFSYTSKFELCVL